MARQVGPVGGKRYHGKVIALGRTFIPVVGGQLIWRLNCFLLYIYARGLIQACVYSLDEGSFSENSKESSLVDTLGPPLGFPSSSGPSILLLTFP